ncbi:MAG: HAD family hydrolase [Proteobacteria bacterium]|nr:HAD family hydrolase [Pseudomonadota bacterium]MBU1708416.1 HAD family hydrolase [Pseudomonadota bacterium]
MKSFKAALFDLDGTLLDTLADLGNSTNNALENLGYPIHHLDAYRYFVGDGALTLISRALPEASRSEESIKTCLEEFIKVYRRNWDNLTKPYSGIMEMLAGLAAKGIKLAVLSNKPDDFTRLCVAKYFADSTFDLVYGQRPGVPKKPDPAGALAIAETLGIDPGEFLYLGDTGIDMKTANAAGMMAVGALWGFRPRAELEGNGAKKLVGTPEEFLHLLS